MSGYFVDLTGVREEQGPSAGDTALMLVAEARSTVEKAKGIIMVAVGCDDVAAFAGPPRRLRQSQTAPAEHYE